MHVDGFRFDLACDAGARAATASTGAAPFCRSARSIPVLGGVKLIAEPWDIGPGRLSGRQFPARLGRVERQVPRRRAGLLARRRRSVKAIAERLCASQETFNHEGRRPWACVNFISAHDGFTMKDVVTYNEKHNDANGEDNNDGNSDNRSWNCGVEGPTDDPEILDAARPARTAT